MSPQPHHGSESEPLSILLFPPHGSRAGRRAQKPNRLNHLYTTTGIILSLAALFAVYTGLARGAVAVAALAITCLLGLWLVNVTFSMSTQKRHLKM